MRMTRRTFVGSTLAAAWAAGPGPIIDTHIHLFDPTRPHGVPWPPKDNATLYKPSLPARYRSIAASLGVVGAIHVEASPWLEDNQWVLDTAEKDPIMVGVVGNLDVTKPDFQRNLDRFRRNRLFRGIRYGNLWGYNLPAQVANGEFVSGMKALAEAGLSLDTANQNPALLGAVVRLNDRVPDLRIIIDHLPQMKTPENPEGQRAYESALRELATRNQVWLKISEVLRRVDGRVPEEVDFYRPTLDRLWDLFGEDRLMYGSDWPNSDQWAPYGTVLRVVHEYFGTKGSAAAEKFFWRNSVAAYRWVKRDKTQPAA